MGPLLRKFARLMKAADVRVHWGVKWPRFKDFPNFEVWDGKETSGPGGPLVVVWANSLSGKLWRLTKVIAATERACFAVYSGNFKSAEQLR